MEKYDVVVIGSGLGGLQCGYILAKQGLNVCVLEKHGQIGGCLQTFKRNGITFDTGFHYVGGLSEGQPLNRIFRYFGLMDLPWRKLDEEAFDEVVMAGESYFFANGFGPFVDTFARRFPHQYGNLKRYAEFLRDVSARVFAGFAGKNAEALYDSPLFARSAYEFLCATIDDPLLRNVLSGTSLKMELCADTLPLYVFAQINGSFIQSAWRLKGGGSQIARSLADSICNMGGTVRTNAEVRRLVEHGGKVEYLETIDGEVFLSKYFISDIHPAAMLELIKDSGKIRNIYRRRMGGLANTFGMFTANIALKDEVVPYLNRNIYVYRHQNVWDCASKPEYMDACIMASFQPPSEGSGFTRNIDILTPMYWQELESWTETTIGHRGQEYENLKHRKLQTCLDLLADAPFFKDVNLHDAIEHVYASTPLSYRDYTATPQGSAYGVRKDYNRLLTTFLSPRTPLPNLLMTGQNLNLHGVLGVSMTAFLTSAEIVGMDVAMREV